MKWSVRIGRFAGIEVRLHATFLLVLGFVIASEVMGRGSVWAAMDGVVFFCSVFACVLLHEFGHALAAARYGIRTHDITLLPIGGVARLERMPDRPQQEFWVALAGPAVNVVIAGVFFAWMLANHGVIGWDDLEAESLPLSLRLLLVNVTLVVFNLVPAFPMDGGRVLRALLALRMDYSRATRIAATLGQVIAVLFAFVGLMGIFGGMGNPLLLFIALFVWIAARQEAGVVELRSQLGGARVRDAMLTSYWTLAPADPLARAVDLVMAGSQQDFPVVDELRVVGILTRKRLLGALSESGRWTPVGASMNREFVVADADGLLSAALQSRSGPTFEPIPVLHRGVLVGLLTWDNVSDYMLIQAALRRPSGRSEMPPVLPA